LIEFCPGIIIIIIIIIKIVLDFTLHNHIFFSVCILFVHIITLKRKAATRSETLIDPQTYMAINTRTLSAIETLLTSQYTVWKLRS